MSALNHGGSLSRNNTPDRQKLRARLNRRRGFRAYACQCSWFSVLEPTDLRGHPQLTWVCSKHGWCFTSTVTMPDSQLHASPSGRCYWWRRSAPDEVFDAASPVDDSSGVVFFYISCVCAGCDAVEIWSQLVVFVHSAERNRVKVLVPANFNLSPFNPWADCSYYSALYALFSFLHSFLVLYFPELF